MSAFFALLNRMKHIHRWGLMRNTQSEDVLQHSAQCAMVAHTLALLGNARLGRRYDPAAVALQALYHEAPEVLTGDLATPIKYFDPDIRKAYRRIETLAAQHLLRQLPGDLQPDFAPLLMPEKDQTAALVKAADRICALLKCLQETGMGNNEFAAALETTKKALAEAPCPEADLFLEIFAPSFSHTLDQQMIDNN